MNIKIVFFDFDWTLFDHRTYEMTPSSKEAILKLKEKGIKVIMATGRSYYSLMSHECLKDIKFDGYVLFNGGVAIANNISILTNYLDKNESKEIIDFLKENKISYGINTLYSSYGKIFSEGDVTSFYNAFDEERALPIDLYKGEEVLSINYYTDESFDKVFKKHFRDVHVARFFDTSTEVMLKQFKKSEGVKKILEYFNIDKNDAMAFGDDINDIDMFNEVGTKVAVGNAKDELKAIANYVTKDIKDDGIYSFLKEMSIIS